MCLLLQVKLPRAPAPCQGLILRCELRCTRPLISGLKGVGPKPKHSAPPPPLTWRWPLLRPPWIATSSSAHAGRRVHWSGRGPSCGYTVGSSPISSSTMLALVEEVLLPLLLALLLLLLLLLLAEEGAGDTEGCRRCCWESLYSLATPGTQRGGTAGGCGTTREATG